MEKAANRVVRPYSINDFLNWRKYSELELVPWFQRREVWSQKARSYLIDTILKNLPVPIIIIRESLDPKTGKTIREVVDGQQRLRSVFEFYDGDLKIDKAHSETLAGKSFSDLPENLQKRFRFYEFPVNLLRDAGDPEVLDIFARINSYTTTLNRQEKLNAKYHGEFKSFIYRMSREYVNFFLGHRVLGQRAVFRMGEAEMISEIVIAMIAGLQDKAKIESFYKKYDEEFSPKEDIKQKFDRICTLINEIFSSGLEINFKGKALFYSLFLVLYDLEYGLPRQEKKIVHLHSEYYGAVKAAIERLNRIIDAEEPKEIVFARACAQATDKQKSRQIRHARIKKEILSFIQTSS